MSKIVTLEQLKQEEQAQKRRDEAKKHLESIGQSIEKVDPKKANKSNDNTLELLLSEKRKNIVNQVNNINTSTNTTASNKQSVPTTANNSNERLQSGWQAVNDTKTGKTYYWNIATNETTWEKPVVEKLSDTSKQREMPPHWVEKIHSATFQTYWEHEKTGNKRWEMPTDDDDGTATISVSNKRTNSEIDNSSKKQQRIEAIGPSMKK